MAESEHLDGLAKRIDGAYRRLAGTPGDRALMLQVGGLLSEAKTRCSDEAWPAWLKDNFEGADHTARGLIALYEGDRVLRSTLDLMNDDDNLTPEGIAARDVLLGDLEAIEQEHRLE